METDPIRGSISSHNTASILPNSSKESSRFSSYISKSRDQISQLSSCIQKRHVLAVYSFFGFFFAYSLRANFSVAIVDMSKSKVNHKIIDLSSANSNQTMLNHHESDEWSTILQGYVLSSFFYGYITTQLPAAFVTSKYGGKFFFGIGIGLCALLSLLMPMAEKIGPVCIMTLRIFQGLSQGFIFPAMHCLWSKWAPPNERSRLATFALSGSYIGSVVALSCSGIISNSLNWKWIFYIFGGFGMIWACLWFTFIEESPSTHSNISAEERLHIESSISFNENKSIPWSSIIRSSAVYAIVCAHFAENWGFYTMITELPTFLSEIMSYKIDKAGIFSSLPYLVMAIVLYSSGFISDKLIERKYSFTLVRKMFCSAGLVLQSIFMFMMVIDGNARTLIAFVTLAIGLGGMAWSSFGVNHLDIGAGYANVLMAYSNTFATIPGILSPIITGHLIEHKTKEEWNAVFCISAAIYLIGAIIYAIIGSGETQKWAISSSKDIETTNTGFSTITKYSTVSNTVKNFTDNSAFALNEKSEISDSQNDESNKKNTA